MHTYTQSEEEPPELEDINDELSEDTGGVPDDTEELVTGTQQTFITELQEASMDTNSTTNDVTPGDSTINDVTPSDSTINDVTPSDSTTNDVTPGDSTTNDSAVIGDNLEEIPLIIPRHFTRSSSQDGLFSSTNSSSVRSKSEQIPPQSLIMGTSPSDTPPLMVPAEREDGKPSPSSSGGGFRPLIEVVSSEENNDTYGTSVQHERPFTEPATTTTHPESALGPSGRPHSHSPLIWSTGDSTSTAAPESKHLEDKGRWANITRAEHPPLSRETGSTGSTHLTSRLLIEELEDDDNFNIGQLPLTAAEQAAIRETDAALEKIKDRAVGELSEEERVWYLAASAGSTLAGREEVELDEETRLRVRDRLAKTGLTDKTSLKF